MRSILSYNHLKHCHYHDTIHFIITGDKSKRPEINQKPTNLLPLPPPTLSSLPKHVPSTSTAPSTVTAVGVMGNKTSLGASFTASKSSSNSSATKQNEVTEKLAVATPNGLLSSHETHHSSSHTKTHTDPASPIATHSHFTLPPPPPPHSQEDVGHVDPVESVSGEGVVSSSCTDTPSTSSCSEHESSCTTSSSDWDEEETATEEDYCEWSKEVRGYRGRERERVRKKKNF